jgi:hypothetical protein
MMSMGVMFWKDNGGGAMMCGVPDCQTHAIHYGVSEVLFCNHSVLASFVSRFADGYLRGRHIGIEFYVCGRRIALSDDL